MFKQNSIDSILLCAFVQSVGESREISKGIFEIEGKPGDWGSPERRNVLEKRNSQRKINRD